MQQTPSKIPIVMSFSSSDPTGGGGIQADIETLFSLGCHCTPVITSITARDTREVKDFGAIPASLLIEQARVVLEDMPVAAFKIGIVGSSENAAAIHTLVRDYPDVPVILQPCLNGTGSADRIDHNIVNAITSLLLPIATIVALDSQSAQSLTPGADTTAACAHKLLEYGCKLLLITGTHEVTPAITNSLYGCNGIIEQFTWERLPNQFLGCSCTLSSSIAAYIALGHSKIAAIQEAQRYTFECLKQGFRIGMGANLPNRSRRFVRK